MFAFAQVLPALRMLVVISVLAGVAYPLFVTAIAQAFAAAESRSA